MIQCRAFRGPGGIDMDSNPIADLAVSGAIADHFNEGFGGNASRTDPAGIKPFVEKILLVIGMELASQMEPDFIDQPGQVNPASHHFTGRTRKNACAHFGMVGRPPEKPSTGLDGFLTPALFLKTNL